MSEPTKKSPEINKLLSSITGQDREATITQNHCMQCEEVADTFRDDLSRAEYTISGLCQSCQDDFFGVSFRDNRTLSEGEQFATSGGQTDSMAAPSTSDGNSLQ